MIKLTIEADSNEALEQMLSRIKTKEQIDKVNSNLIKLSQENERYKGLVEDAKAILKDKKEVLNACRRRISELEESCENFVEVERNLQKKIKELEGIINERTGN